MNEKEPYFMEASSAYERAIMEALKAQEQKEKLPDQRAKADAGKPQLTLVPTQILYDIAAIRAYGCRKYPDGGKDNWRQVEVERYRDAAFRHFLSYIDNPSGTDKESGFPHLWHCECNIAFLADLEKGRWK